MAQRTTVKLVIELLGGNYGPVKTVLPNVQPYIDMAWPIVDFVVGIAAARNRGLTEFQKELVERCLACHFYTKMDPLYTSDSQGGASGSYVAAKDEPERYKCMAQNADTSGFLTAVLARQFAEGVYLGPTPQQPRDSYSTITER